MMRGYKCVHKTGREILLTLGFNEKDAIRGWVINRTGGRTPDAPVRIHAFIHRESTDEYIDIHADHQGPNDSHISTRGRRIERWNELFKQIDHDEPCDAGHKLLAHYGGLEEALIKYHEKQQNV